MLATCKVGENKFTKILKAFYCLILGRYYHKLYDIPNDLPKHTPTKWHAKYVGHGKYVDKKVYKNEADPEGISCLITIQMLSIIQ